MDTVQYGAAGSLMPAWEDPQLWSGGPPKLNACSEVKSMNVAISPLGLNQI